MIKSYQQRLAEKLLAEEKISKEIYESLLDQETNLGKNIEEIILSRHILDEESLTQTKAEIIGYPYADLTDFEIKPEVFSTLPENIVNQYKAFCFDLKDSNASIALLDPSNAQAVESIDFYLNEKNIKANFFIVSNASFDSATKGFVKMGKEVESVLEEAKEEIGEIELPEEKAANVSEIVKKAPVSQVVSLIFKHAVENGASDIHIEPDEVESRVRYRIDGVLHTFLILPIYIHSSVISRIKVLAKLKLDETRIPQDGRIKVKINNIAYDMRVSTLPLLNNEKASIRILETGAVAPTLFELGFNQQSMDIINEEIKKPHGMFLITGPTGSGKSTTLYSILSIINKEDVNIVTLEDPVEYYISGVNQSLIRADIGYSFASGLRAILRQDPNVIMVGEIRDTETAELAVHAGLTGHLLFSTLHTNDAFGVVPRLIDMKVEPFLLASTLNILVAQRLVRKICKDCKTKKEIPEKQAEQIRHELQDIPKRLLPDIDLTKNLYEYVGAGCPKCNNSGYLGRTVVSEVLQITNTMQKLIISGFDMDAVRKEAKRQGMVNLRQDGFIKVVLGTTTLEEVLRVSKEEEEQE